MQQHNLVSVRVAEALDLMTIRGRPWIFEAPDVSANQVSVLNLDEYMALLLLEGVKRTNGAQCLFGALSSKPTGGYTGASI